MKLRRPSNIRKNEIYNKQKKKINRKRKTTQRGKKIYDIKSKKERYDSKKKKFSD